jgi:energy-coupling factor transporter ATP-binding protein EcfA2
VLGGGVRAGSLVLIGGGPGLGKSTLLIQLAALIAVAPPWGAAAGSALARASGRVLYISGEESEDQLADRAERLQVRASHSVVARRPADPGASRGDHQRASWRPILLQLQRTDVGLARATWPLHLGIMKVNGVQRRRWDV